MKSNAFPSSSSIKSYSLSISLTHLRLEFVIDILTRNFENNKIYVGQRSKCLNTELTSRPSSHYRRSPLVQGGLEIRCKIAVKTSSSFNKAVFERYKDEVKELYVEPKDEEILGSFLLEDSLLPPNNRQIYIYIN